MISPLWLHGFKYTTCHHRSKIGKNCGFGYIFGFGLVWSGFELVQMTYLKSPLLKYMLFDTQHVPVDRKLAITIVWSIFLVLVWFDLILDWFKWLIIGVQQMPQLTYMLFDTQCVSVDKKLTKIIYLTIILDFLKFDLVQMSNVRPCFLIPNMLLQAKKSPTPLFWLSFWSWSGLVWFWNGSSELLLNSLAWIYDFYTQNTIVCQILAKTMLLLFSFGFIWGHQWISQLEYMLLDTKHVQMTIRGPHWIS